MAEPICRDCGDPVHDPGKCYRDNCGDGELIRSGSGYTASVLEPTNAYVSGAVYSRKAEPRRVFKRRGREDRVDGRFD